MSGVVKLVNGGTITVQTGVLQGEGPRGPRGFDGKEGPASTTAGPPGPPGSVRDYGILVRGVNEVNTPSGNWTVLNWPTTDFIDVIDPSANPQTPAYTQSGNGFSVVETGVYAITAYAMFTDSNSIDGLRSMGLFNTSDASGFPMTATQTTTDQNSSTITYVTLTTVQKLTANVVYYVAAKSDSSPTTQTTKVTSRSLYVVRIGAGPNGKDGKNGEQGAPGSVTINAGIPSFGALCAEGGNTNLADVQPTPPVGTVYEAQYPSSSDPQFVIPTNVAKTRVPWFFKAYSDSLLGRIVSRFSAKEDYTNSRPIAKKNFGDLVYVSDTDGLYIFSKDFTSSATEVDKTKGKLYPIARVITSTGDPTGKQAPGTLWLKTASIS